MSFDAGTILAYLKLDRSGFTSGMLEAQGITSALGSTIGSFLANPLVGVANVAKSAVGGIIDVVNSTVQAAGESRRLATQMGSDVHFASGIAAAAKEAHVPVEALSMGMNILQRNAADAATGTGTAVNAFQQLGISVKDGNGQLKTGQALMLEAADALNHVSNSTQRAAIAQDIFGRGALELAPLLNKGRAGIQAMIADADELGLTFTDKSAAAAVAFGKSIEKLKMVFEGAFRDAIMPLIEGLLPLFQALATLLKPIAELLGFIMKAVTAPLAALGKGLGEMLGGGAGGHQVNVQVSPEDSARAVANRVAPAIVTGVRSVQYGVERSTQRRIEQYDFEGNRRSDEKKGTRD